MAQISVGEIKLRISTSFDDWRKKYAVSGEYVDLLSQLEAQFPPRSMRLFIESSKQYTVDDWWWRAVEDFEAIACHFHNQMLSRFRANVKFGDFVSFMFGQTTEGLYQLLFELCVEVWRMSPKDRKAIQRCLPDHYLARQIIERSSTDGSATVCNAIVLTVLTFFAGKIALDLPKWDLRDAANAYELWTQSTIDFRMDDDRRRLIIIEQ